MNKAYNLLDEWNSSKNAPLNPLDISYGSEKVIWWVCKICGHHWSAKCNSRTNGSLCPECSKKNRVEKSQHTKITKRGSLFDKYPDLSREWDYKQNNERTPHDYCSGSNMKVWWLCPQCNCSYESRISSRSHGSACPFCKNRRRNKTIVKKSGSLFDINPELDQEWLKEKNEFLSMKDITKSSNKNYWWRCNNGHEWQASAATRAKGHSCPYCSGRNATAEKNLMLLAPELIIEWHPTKNNDILPSDVSPYSGKKVWWICSKGHEWQATISNRYQGRGCAQCSAELKSSFPEQALIYYLSKYYDVENRNKFNGWELDIYLPQYNIGIEYDGIAYHSKDFLVEREQRKNNAFKESGIDLIRIKESLENQAVDGCTIYFQIDYKYTNLKVALVMLFALLTTKTKVQTYEEFNIENDRIDIMARYMEIDRKNNFAEKYPDLVIFWDYNKNKKLRPESFRAMSNRKVWWECPVCQGSWEETIINVAKGNRCPFCSNHKVLSGFNDLLTTNPDLASEWHPDKNVGLIPSEVTAGSNKKVWWLCKNKHEWRATISRRTANENCPYCSRSHKLIPLRDKQWMEKYEAAKRFFEEYGNLEVKATYICDDGVKLGGWIRTQRGCLKNQDLNPDRIQLLEKISMIWDSKPGTKRSNENVVNAK